MAPLLSVIIVAYKSGDEIDACLASLPRRLLDREVEIVVVNNSPEDATGRIVAGKYPKVRYLPAPENLGFGRANNLGYDRIDPASEFVLFLNPDTVCNERALVRCIEILRADSSVGLVSPKLVLADGSMDLACRRSIPTLWDGFCRAAGLAAAFPNTKLFSGYNLTYLSDEGHHEVGAINGAFMMGKRGVFDAVAKGSELRAKSSGNGHSALGAERLASSDELSAVPDQFSTLNPQPSTSHRAVFDEDFFMYGDDLDLCIRVARAGLKIIYDGSVEITHLKGLSVAKDYDRMSEAIFDANRDVYLKHFNPHGSRCVLIKYTLAFGLWKKIARLRARGRNQRRVRPL